MHISGQVTISLNSRPGSEFAQNPCKMTLPSRLSCFHHAVSSTLFLLWLFELATPTVGVVPRRPPSRQPGVGLHSADAQARCSLNIPSPILGESPHGANEEQVKISSVHVSPLFTTLWPSRPYHQPVLVSWWFVRFTSYFLDLSSVLARRTWTWKVVHGQGQLMAGGMWGQGTGRVQSNSEEPLTVCFEFWEVL